jgi:hypothetical protein
MFSDATGAPDDNLELINVMKVWVYNGVGIGPFN